MLQPHSLGCARFLCNRAEFREPAEIYVLVVVATSERAAPWIKIFVQEHGISIQGMTVAAYARDAFSRKRFEESVSRQAFESFLRVPEHANMIRMPRHSWVGSKRSNATNPPQTVEEPGYILGAAGVLFLES